MNPPVHSQSHPPFDLTAAARAEMIRDGFHLFPDAPEDEAQLTAIRAQLATPDNSIKDLRSLLWSSIDNDTSRDLDQIEYAERTPDGIRVLVGIADVASAVAKGSPLDRIAADQAQTIYTAVHNFPMLPFELSTDLTSLNENEDRAAIVIEFTVDANGLPTKTSIYAANVRNKAQLAYSTTGPFLEDKPRPDGRYEPQLAASPDLAAQLRLQDEAAQLLHTQRVKMGALDFNRVEADPVVIDGKVQAIQAVEHNRASQLIENFMIAANETMAGTLRNAGRSCIRRVVRSPERWARIVALVAAKGTHLPAQPDSAALNDFLQAQRASRSRPLPRPLPRHHQAHGPRRVRPHARGDDPDPPGHFGLAARDYTHSTAPNRRFADLVTQRILKALLANQPRALLRRRTRHHRHPLTERDTASRKVERAMQKRVAAVALAGQIGHQFQGVITGASDKGTFVRVFNPPVEGRIVHGFQGLDVGDTTNVTLSHTDPVHAFIDFTHP